MSALHNELASLVADVAAWLRAWEEDGGDQLAGGASPVRTTEVPDEPLMQARPRPAVSAPVAPRPAPPRPVTPVAASVPRAPAPPPAAGAALFGTGLGKWAAWAAPDPAEQLRAHRSGLAEHCPGCGQRTVRLEGSVRARLVVLAAPMAGKATEMFEKMLVRVLSLERSDVLAAEPRDCRACLASFSAELAIVRPRVVLAMGPAARSMVGAGGLGTWTRLGDVDVMPTFHTDELLARPADKRPAFDHLKLVAERL